MTSHPEPELRSITPAAGSPSSRADAHVGYLALREVAVLFDRSARGRMLFQGPRAAEVITGMVTNDVQALRSGLGAYACALSPKGRIIADIRIFVREGDLLIDCAERAVNGWRDMARKYVNPRLVPYRDADTIRDIGVFGPASRGIVAAAFGVDEDTLCDLPPYAHVTGTPDDATVMIARSPELKLEGYDVFVDAARFDESWQRLLDRGAVIAESETWHVARVEAGRPEWGIDMDDTTLPQEANMDELGAISYTKGCYVGQEVVARIHFRGHVNRHLRGLRFRGTQAVSPGAALVNAQGKTIGDVRSSVESPRLGRIAIGMVRREVGDGEDVAVRSESIETSAQVTGLPFPD